MDAVAPSARGPTIGSTETVVWAPVSVGSWILTTRLPTAVPIVAPATTPEVS
jgi:hypothetical protein